MTSRPKVIFSLKCWVCSKIHAPHCLALLMKGFMSGSPVFVPCIMRCSITGYKVTSYICQLPLINVYATLGHHSWTQSNDLNVFLIDLETQEWILMQFGGFFCFYCWYFWKRHIMEFSQKKSPFCYCESDVFERG